MKGGKKSREKREKENVGMEVLERGIRYDKAARKTKVTPMRESEKEMNEEEKIKVDEKEKRVRELQRVKEELITR